MKSKVGAANNTDSNTETDVKSGLTFKGCSDARR